MTEEVNLRPDDDATLDEIEAEAEAPVEEPEAAVATPDEEEARELAVHYRDEADGDSVVEQLGNALDAAGNDVEQLSQMHSKYERQVHETDQRIDRLDDTYDRVANQPDDVPILQTMAGGISLEVPTESEDGYDRADLLDEIDETCEALDGHIDGLESQMQGVEAAYERTAMALRLLKRAYDREKQTDELADDLTQDLR